MLICEPGKTGEIYGIFPDKKVTALGDAKVSAKVLYIVAKGKSNLHFSCNLVKGNELAFGVKTTIYTTILFLA